MGLAVDLIKTTIVLQLQGLYNISQILIDQRGIFKFLHPGIVKRAVFPV